MESLEYEIKYPNLDIQQLIKNQRLFDYGVIAAYVKDYEKGFKVKNVSKTYRTGTNFTYIPISDNKQLEQYKRLLIGLINVHNIKYEVQITLEEFCE